MNEKVIECVNLEKKYFLFEKDYKIIPWLFTKKGNSGVRVPLTDINLSIYKGDVVGFVGKNGAGKSTLMKIIAGITMHTDGGIKVKGRVNSLINLGAGFNPKYTGRQNIYYKGLLMGINKIEIDNIIEDIIDFCDIGEYFDLPLYMYSSGMNARLGFALAVFAEHDILIVDEIFSVGDKSFRKKSEKKMKELFSSGKSIIFASHSDSQIRQFCNRAIFIDESKIIVDGTVEEVLEAYNSKYFPNKTKIKILNNKFTNIEKLLNLINTSKLDNAEVFRELALFHEVELNYVQAFRYMQLALNIRPTGPLILEKVKEYRAKLTDGEIEEINEIDKEHLNIKRFLDVVVNATKNTVQKPDLYIEIAILLEQDNYMELANKYMRYARELRATE